MYQNVSFKIHIVIILVLFYHRTIEVEWNENNYSKNVADISNKIVTYIGNTSDQGSKLAVVSRILQL